MLNENVTWPKKIVNDHVGEVIDVKCVITVNLTALALVICCVKYISNLYTEVQFKMTTTGYLFNYNIHFKLTIQYVNMLVSL